MQFYFNPFKTKKYTKIKKKVFFLGKCKTYRIKKCVILIAELIRTKNNKCFNGEIKNNLHLFFYGNAR